MSTLTDSTLALRARAIDQARRCLATRDAVVEAYRRPFADGGLAWTVERYELAVTKARVAHAALEGLLVLMGAGSLTVDGHLFGVTSAGRLRVLEMPYQMAKEEA